jgi:hypothetical protein
MEAMCEIKHPGVHATIKEVNFNGEKQDRLLVFSGTVLLHSKGHVLLLKMLEQSLIHPYGMV